MRLFGRSRRAGRDRGSGIRDRASEASVDDRAAEPSPPQSRSRAAELLAPAYRTRTFIVWLLWACAYFITNGLNNWMPTLYSSVYHLSLGAAPRGYLQQHRPGCDSARMRVRD